jgi:hypothetical protein
MADIINEKQGSDARYDKHKEWRAQNKDTLSAQNARKRANDQKLNKLPGRKQGAMEAAREAVRCAIERGDLVRPAKCQNPKCGKKTDRLIFHHSHGYDPEHFLTGQFLCTKCHAEDDNNKPGDRTVQGAVRGPRPGVTDDPKHSTRAAMHNAIANVSEDKLVSDIADLITEDPDIFRD